MKLGRKPGRKHDDGDDPDIEVDVPSNTPDPAKLVRKSARKSRTGERAGKRGYLDGQMLIAMPTMGDERFARSVIYMCAHSSEGAMGIIVNHPAANISFPDLLVQLDVVGSPDLTELPAG